MPVLEEFYEMYEEKYHGCCFAFIKNNQLHIVSKPDLTGNSKLAVYQLKSAVSTILKKDVDPKRLFYIAGKIYHG